MTVFDIVADLKIPCFCLACLVGKKKSEMANDKYCHECQEILSYECSQRLSEPLCTPKTTIHDYTPTQNTQSKLSILRVRSGTYQKRALPKDLIRRWASEGEGSRAIATRLKGQGIFISYRTILRFLNGQGNG